MMLGVVALLVTTGVVVGLLAQTSRTSLATLKQKLDGHRRLAPGDEAKP